MTTQNVPLDGTKRAQMSGSETTDRAWSQMTGCTNCACYAKGRQDEAFDTYSDNLAASLEAEYWRSRRRDTEPIETARDHIQRWHDR